MTSPLMDLNQAEQLGIHPKTLSVYARRGEIAYRIGLGKTTPYKFSQEQIDAFLKAHLNPVRKAL